MISMQQQFIDNLHDCLRDYTYSSGCYSNASAYYVNTIATVMDAVIIVVGAVVILVHGYHGNDSR